MACLFGKKEKHCYTLRPTRCQALSPNCAAPLNHLWRSPGLMGEGHAFIVQVRPEPGPEFQRSVHCFLRPCCLLVASSIEWSQYFILFCFSGNKASILNNDKWSITFKSVNQYVIHIITYDYILLYINYTTIKNNKKETLVKLGRQLHRQVNYQFVRTPTFVSHMLSMYAEILCCQIGLSKRSLLWDVSFSLNTFFLEILTNFTSDDFKLTSLCWASDLHSLHLLESVWCPEHTSNSTTQKKQHLASSF